MPKQTIIQRKLWAVINDDAASEGEKANARKAIDNIENGKKPRRGRPPKKKPRGPWHILSPACSVTTDRQILRGKEITQRGTIEALCGEKHDLPPYGQPGWWDERFTDWSLVRGWRNASAVICPVCLALAAHEVRQLEQEQPKALPPGGAA